MRQAQVYVLPDDFEAVLALESLSEETRRLAELAKAGIPVCPSILFIADASEHDWTFVVQGETREEFRQALNTLRQKLDVVSGQLWLSHKDRSIQTDFELVKEIQRVQRLSVQSQRKMDMLFHPRLDNGYSGVAYTRHPVTGSEEEIFGEFIAKVAPFEVTLGEIKPLPLGSMDEQLYQKLMKLRKRLDTHLGDLHSFYFVFCGDTPYIAAVDQENPAPQALVRITADLVKKRRISQREALRRISPEIVEELFHPVLDLNASSELRPLAKGAAASPGAAVGRIALSKNDAMIFAAADEPYIYVASYTTPNDIDVIAKAQGILTSSGGRTSHAAVIARGLGKPCIVGAGRLVINDDNIFTISRVRQASSGDWITINGTTGEAWLGKAVIQLPQLTADTEALLRLADKHRRLKVYANADDAEAVAKAIELGAEGIGLIRTEHMLAKPYHLQLLRQIMLLEFSYKRQSLLEELEALHRRDFRQIFLAAQGRPVTIRLLDPPLHEFFSLSEDELSKLSKLLRSSKEDTKKRIERLKETNPMLGHRGCRLAITHPDIYGMQTRAIIGAAVDAVQEGVRVEPDIMIPLIGSSEELVFLRERATAAAQDVLNEMAATLNYTIGTMVETPRAALLAGDIAHHADFVSFGTNDLTQMFLGISRDDASFVEQYLDEGIYEDDPFVTIDVDGVGELVRQALRAGRRTRPGMTMGVCGEHAGEPKSIAFFHKAKLDYVSCSPYRVPVARLAAAHARLGM